MAGPRIAPSLAGYIPAPAGSGPQVAPRRGILSELENLSYGIGEGQVAQLEGYEAMIRHPAAAIAALYRAASNPSQTITAMAADAMQKARGGPIGIGQLLGEGFSPRSLLGVNAATTAMNKPGLLQELDVYHGTPHRFPPTEANPLGEFDASKIGTGEGAQVYGHGVYLAEAPEVAMGYAKGVKDMGSIKAINDEMSVLAKTMRADEAGEYGKYRSDAGRNAAKRYADLLDQRQKVIDQPGNLLKADLPDEMIDRMLDWDKPINEQNKAVLDALEKAGINTHSTALAGPMARGQEAHLAKHGIPGIRYLDANSRDGGSGTRNFVVFPGEEKRVRILKRE